MTLSINLRHLIQRLPLPNYIERGAFEMTAHLQASKPRTRILASILTCADRIRNVSVATMAVHHCLRGQAHCTFIASPIAGRNPICHQASIAARAATTCDRCAARTSRDASSKSISSLGAWLAYQILLSRDLHILGTSARDALY